MGLLWMLFGLMGGFTLGFLAATSVIDEDIARFRHSIDEDIDKDLERIIEYVEQNK